MWSAPSQHQNRTQRHAGPAESATRSKKGGFRFVVEDVGEQNTEFPFGDERPAYEAGGLYRLVVYRLKTALFAPSLKTSFETMVSPLRHLVGFLPASSCRVTCWQMKFGR